MSFNIYFVFYVVLHKKQNKYIYIYIYNLYNHKDG
jgi:hypothetical protein